MSTAAATLDAELQRAAGDDHFALILRGCVRGGRATLDSFCDHVGDPAEKVDEAPAVDILRAMTDPHAEPDTRDGQRMRFSRESLEYVIGAATGTRPARRDLLLVISPWTTCFMRGFRVFGTRLQELEGLHPDALAS